MLMIQAREIKDLCFSLRRVPGNTSRQGGCLISRLKGGVDEKIESLWRIYIFQKLCLILSEAWFYFEETIFSLELETAHWMMQELESISELPLGGLPLTFLSPRATWYSESKLLSSVLYCFPAYIWNWTRSATTQQNNLFSAIYRNDGNNLYSKS